ncbi:hypothetical protein YC2023_077990 [Brassica napus]
MSSKSDEDSRVSRNNERDGDDRAFLEYFPSLKEMQVYAEENSTTQLRDREVSKLPESLRFVDHVHYIRSDHDTLLCFLLTHVVMITNSSRNNEWRS